MKKVAFAFLAMCCALFLAGCNEKNRGQTVQSAEPIGDEKVAPTKSLSSTLMISSGWTLCRENEDGTMSSAKETAIGDVVSVVWENESIVRKTADWEFQNGTRTKNVDWLLVSCDGEEYWTRDLFLASDGKGEHGFRAVTIEDARVYSAADEMTMTKEVIEEGTNVAVMKTNVGGNYFAEIKLYNGKPFGRSVYVSQFDFSDSKLDAEYYAVSAKIEALQKDMKDEVGEEMAQLLSLIDELRKSMARI